MVAERGRPLFKLFQVKFDLIILVYYQIYKRKWFYFELNVAFVVRKVAVCA